MGASEYLARVIERTEQQEEVFLGGLRGRTEQARLNPIDGRRLRLLPALGRGPQVPPCQGSTRGASGRQSAYRSVRSLPQE
eukprot:471622-Pyramimonas_sp.AAC.1